MSGILVLRHSDARAMAFLHGACFSETERWTEQSFDELLALPTTLALGLGGRFGLNALILIQDTDPDSEVLTICVAPTARRTGLASQLFDAVLQMLGQRGTARIMLDVAADNLDALDFYAKHGFQEDSRRKDYYRRGKQPRVDAVLMSRDIAGQI